MQQLEPRGSFSDPEEMADTAWWLPAKDGHHGWLEFVGLENDGAAEQEETYMHAKKNFNVYDM